VNLRFVIFSATWRVHFGHLPRARRATLGYFLADLNLVVFQKAWRSGRREPGQVPYLVGGASCDVPGGCSSVRDLRSWGCLDTNHSDQEGTDEQP